MRRLDRAKSWLHDHWEAQQRLLQQSQACVAQARSLGEVGGCARIAQQTMRMAELLQTSACAPAQEVLPSQQTSGSP